MLNDSYSKQANLGAGHAGVEEGGAWLAELNSYG